MRKNTLATLIIFILPLALGLFYVKHMVQNLEEDLSSLERQIKNDKEEIHVLKAEWAYLSRPERVKVLAAQNLDLQPTSSEQIAEINSIPLRSDALASAETHVASASF
jgi:cell division protein FtsL